MCDVVAETHHVCQQAEALGSVISILGCSRSTARLLLMHFRWDSDLLFGECFGVHTGKLDACIAGVSH